MKRTTLLYIESVKYLNKIFPKSLLISGLFFCLLFCTFTVKASENEKEVSEKTFNTAEYLFEHVNDSHEWFFCSTKRWHGAIPLPVILYSKQSGWHFFWSNSLKNEPTNSALFYLAHGGPHDGLIVEKCSDGSEIVPLDLSITKTVFATLIISLLMVFFVLKASKKTIAHPFNPPGKGQNLVEPIVTFVRDEIAKPFIGHDFKRFMPYLITLFLFILTANMVGLILPLGFNITGNIAVTATLGLFTFVLTLINGNKRYWLHIVNPDVPIFMKFPIPLMPIIELAGVFIKPLILTIRLFANMFAGHVIVTVLIALIFLMSIMSGLIAGFVTSFISVLFSVFIVLLDILISFIQAYIFTLLSAMYFGMALDKGQH